MVKRLVVIVEGLREEVSVENGYLELAVLSEKFLCPSLQVAKIISIFR